MQIRQSAAGELTGDPPSCTLVAQWEGASEVQQLSYLVKLSGTNTPKFFYISSPGNYYIEVTAEWIVCVCVCVLIMSRWMCVSVFIYLYVCLYVLYVCTCAYTCVCMACVWHMCV